MDGGHDMPPEEMMREYVVSEFKGGFPPVPHAMGVDVEALTKGDSDPFYVTLPVARMGEVSGNKLLYDEALVKSIVEQINSDKPTGIMGHISSEDLSSAFPEPEVYWIGAALDGNTAWAKGYVPPGKARDHLHRQKATGGRIATSIFGPPPDKRIPTQDGKAFRIEGWKLQQLDLAPYERAALKLGGQFAVTREMNEEDAPVDKAQVIAELKAEEIPASIREQIVKDYEAQQQSAKRIAEIEGERDVAKKRIAELETQVTKLSGDNFVSALNTKIAELVKVETLRTSAYKAVIAEIGKGNSDLAAAEKALSEYLESDEYKELAEMAVGRLAGPAAFVAGRSDKAAQVKDTPENRAEARRIFGF
jgi:hypothetical protein